MPLRSAEPPSRADALHSQRVRVACNMQRTTCNMQHVTCHVLYAARDLQRATCNSATRINNVQRKHALRGVGHAPAPLQKRPQGCDAVTKVGQESQGESGGGRGEVKGSGRDGSEESSIQPSPQTSKYSPTFAPIIAADPFGISPLHDPVYTVIRLTVIRSTSE